MFLLIACLCVHVQEAFNRGAYAVPMGRFGFVQPNVPSTVKWDPAAGPGILDTLEQTTLTVAKRRPDLILWPEAVTPWAVRGDATVQAFVEDLARKAEVPILLGSIAIEPPVAGSPADAAETWYNGSFLVEPSTGLVSGYYAKRHLVPFGEFVPLRPLFGWLEKFVPIGGDFAVGEGAGLMPVVANREALLVGPLICYEDIFPGLARESVLAGADLLVVQTNNGWFGEEGAAFQHAAHSVLRAVETRRPVLRVGNAGWSGWIDEFGSVRALIQKVVKRNPDGRLVSVASSDPNETGTIYFKGSAIADVSRDARWIGRQSFYVQHGNWFGWTCAALFVAGVVLVRISPPPAVVAPEDDTDEPGAV